MQGVQDAMVQWWYGHNAVGFFLTAGFLGMMYYFIPKQAQRPVYSLSLVDRSFLGADFYLHVGGPAPSALHRFARLDTVSRYGVFLILLAPSWGGMINGIMTLSGAWHKLRDDPILRFLIVSLSFYGMSHFRRPHDVDQDGQCLVALHRLDRWPRAFRCLGLGWSGDHGQYVLPDSAAVWSKTDVQREARLKSISGWPRSAS
jgi:hypothetical protein